MSELIYPEGDLDLALQSPSPVLRQFPTLHDATVWRNKLYARKRKARASGVKQYGASFFHPWDALSIFLNKETYSVEIRVVQPVMIKETEE